MNKILLWLLVLLPNLVEAAPENLLTFNMEFEKGSSQARFQTVLSQGGSHAWGPGRCISAETPIDESLVLPEQQRCTPLLHTPKPL